MPRPAIADLAKAANVSVSTVDRVLNGRDPVRRDKAERVLAIAEEIGFRATGVLRQRIGGERPERAFAFILQQPADHFYSLLGPALVKAVRSDPSIQGDARVELVDGTSARAVVDCLRKLARKVDGIGIIAADHPLLSAGITELRARRPGHPDGEILEAGEGADCDAAALRRDPAKGRGREDEGAAQARQHSPE